MMDKKKEFGQYFTNINLVRLILNSIGKSIHDDTVLDPMCGSGNMLAAARVCGAEERHITGIEIDSDICRNCRDIMPKANILNENAFDIWQHKRELYQRTLVLANPPYVRYQRTSNNDKISNETIKASLKKLIDLMDEMADPEKEIFVKAIESYSGLADLSMPAWILCMAMTRISGWMIIVLPETWKKRDYSQSILSLFLQEFELHFMIEDKYKNWFEDALVRTNILVAKKREKIVDLKNAAREEFIFAHVGSDMENIFIDKKMHIFEIYPILLKNKCNIIDIDNSIEKLQYKDVIIRNLEEECGIKINGRRLTNIQYYGLNVGQGLRTGANKFFYVEAVDEQGGKTVISPDVCWNLGQLSIDSGFLRPVVRKQCELKKSVSINDACIKGRVLLIREKIGSGDNLYRYIKLAENVPVAVKGEKRFIFQLSAVRTNISGKNEWYMLPELGRRHIPDLFVPRINNDDILFFDNKSKYIIDANFSSIWLCNYDEAVYYAMLAVFNSKWIRAQLEDIGTELGGGALKVEASHIKMLLLPVLNQEEILNMAKQGRRLCEPDNDLSEVRKEIDIMILKKVIQTDNTDMAYRRITDYIGRKLVKRRVR